MSPRIFDRQLYYYWASFFKANLNQHEDLSNEIDSEALPVGKIVQYSWHYSFFCSSWKLWNVNFFSNIRIRNFQKYLDPDPGSMAKNDVFLQKMNKIVFNFFMIHNHVRVSFLLMSKTIKKWRKNNFKAFKVIFSIWSEIRNTRIRIHQLNLVQIDADPDLDPKPCMKEHTNLWVT